MQINKNFANLKENYLFRTVAQKVADYKAASPEKPVIRLGIGDVTLPLAPKVVSAMAAAVGEMGQKATFRGYDDNHGYPFLKQAIQTYYRAKAVEVEESEIFIGDGAKSDLGNILDIFGPDNTVLVPDPVYPVYVDTNLMAGRRVAYIDGTVQNAFLPGPQGPGGILYLCSPNNPTGAVYSKAQLAQWVAWALENDAVILFDAAYEAFVRDPALPTSIFQIPGAKECAIEFCSFSKTAGFTGTRCGYTVVPQALRRDGASLNQLWSRRQATKFNGVAYIVQRGAEAALSPEGLAQIRQNIGYYMGNATMIGDTLRALGIWFTGGENSPYIWLRCPNSMTSWEFFDFLLDRANLVGTPGAGFGANGEGFFRLTAFGDGADVETAMARLRGIF
jgi:LL-diaminopimelate aminotransferase